MAAATFLSSLSISRKLLLLLAIVWLPVFGIIVALSLSQRADEIREAENDVLLLVQGLAAQQVQLTAATRQMLGTLAMLPAVKNPDASACSQLFAELVRNRPVYGFIGMATPHGNLVACSAPFVHGSVNLSDGQHVREAIRTLDFSVGEYTVGRVLKEPSLSFGYPVLDAEGKLVAILIASLNLQEYGRFLTGVNLPRDSLCIVADRNGRRLFSFPESDLRPVGAYVPEDVLQRVKGDSEQGSFEKTGLDGIYRINAFKKLGLGENHPPYIYIAVGISKAQVVRGANLKMLNSLAGIGLLELLGVLVVWMTVKRFLIRPINRLVETTRRFGDGNMEARTGLAHTPDELGRLAESFDGMASLLEAGNIKRMQAEVRIRTAELKKANEKLETEIIVRKRVEDSLRFALAKAEDEKSRSESIIAGISDSLTILDRDFQVVYQNEVSKAYRRNAIGGYCYHEFRGTDQICDECQVAGCFSDGGVHRKEASISINGKPIYVDITASPLRNAAGEIIGAIEIARDISKHKLAEEALIESRRRLANIIDFLPEATFVIDKEGKVMAWNRAMEQFTGTSADAVLGKSSSELSLLVYGESRPVLIDLVLNPDREIEAGYLNVRRKDGRLYAEAYAPALRGGHERYLSGTASLLYDSQGNVVGAIESIRDVTYRRLMEEGLQDYPRRLQVKAGLAGFREYEDLELLLTYAVPVKEVRYIARNLMNEFGNNLALVFDAPVEALLRVDGVGAHAAGLVSLMPRLFNAYMATRWARHEDLGSTDVAVSYIRALLGTQRNEIFCVLALDSQNRLIAVERIQKGSVNRTAVFPRLIVEVCLKHRATAVILAHNHPGGDPLPSTADMHLTCRLKKILGDLDIVLHDHIIVAGYDQYYSFAQTGGLSENATSGE